MNFHEAGDILGEDYPDEDPDATNLQAGYRKVERLEADMRSHPIFMSALRAYQEGTQDQLMALIPQIDDLKPVESDAPVF
ncbi:MAG: hypothetical protein ABIH34_00830 [Nanoarchaeota archaeon]